MIDLNSLTHEQKELLAEDCEDFLLHRNIPLRSHCYDTIIQHAFVKDISLKSLIAT